MKTFLLLLIFLLLNLSAHDLFALRARKGAPTPSKTIQFSGVVSPAKTFQLFLRPGENIIDITVEKEQQVSAGTLVATISNERLYALYNDCVDKTVQFSNMKFALEKLELSRQSLLRQKKSFAHRLQKLADLAKAGIETGVNSKIWAFQEKSDKLDFNLATIQKEIALKQKTLANYSGLIRNNKTMLASLQKRIDQLSIRSDIDGIVKKIHARGWRANPGDLIVEIWDTAQLTIRAKVSQNHIEYLHVGDQVRIASNFYTTAFEMGTVEEIGTEVLQEHGSTPSQPSFPVLIQPLNHEAFQIGHEVIITVPVQQ